MENQKYAKLIEQLKQDKTDTLERARKLITEDLRDSIGELSLIDNHPADIGTAVYERSRDVAMHDRYIHHVAAIDSALQRWEEGSYGSCEHCGETIPFERLEVLPFTTVCTECSRLEEEEEQHSVHREPVEDEVLNRPFSRTFNDGIDQVEFDGEDSWQAVAQFGTADSPQDLGTNRDISDPNEMYEDADEVIGAVDAIETLEVEVEPGFGNTIYYDKQHGRT